MNINTLFLEKKYASLTSSMLDQSKSVSTHPYLLRFRCNVCGDSKRNKYKTRAYIYEKNNNLSIKCHNCGYTNVFRKWLQEYFPNLYNEYRLESIREWKNTKKLETFKIIENDEKNVNDFNPLQTLKSVFELDDTTIAKKYVKSRLFLFSTYKLFYHCDKFYSYINSLIPGKFSETVLKNDEPRLIIPLKDKNGKCFGLQGRSYKKNSSLRYITIMFDDNMPKIFGLDRVDSNEVVYVVEGPIDSTFLKNSVALVGSDGIGLLDKYIPKENMVIIYDNQSRNEHIVQKIKHTIENGYKVVIFPNTLKYKDINDMVLGGMSIEEIHKMINSNTHKGMKAMMMLSKWKRI